ncbi:uncharacterized protein LOC131948907 [Physella acuta]|uniref:uncharacterized protein LOC131948907 n=1 Tax=Physella acuta TaxID=109671 RepID=UPI0027DBF3ED|nr:uncharacterized protein LOC131948907 [Physella acuta]
MVIIWFSVVILFSASAVAQPAPPDVRVDGQSLTDGDEFTLPYTSSTNETVARVECREPRDTDLATGVELVCRGLKVPGDEQRVFLVPYNKYSDKILCTCYLRFASVENYTDFTFILNIQYVPEQVPVATIEGQPIKPGITYSHQANKYITNIRCNVPDGNPPISNYTITCSTSNGYKSSTLEPDDDLMLDVQGQGHGNCTCRPNHVTGLYNRTTSFYIEYNVQPYVPQTPPTISIGKQKLSDGEVLIMESNRTVSCAVMDGYPRVQQITFQCGPYTRTVLNYTGDFTIPYNKVYNQQTCVCTASHVTGLYHLNSTILLDVRYEGVITSLRANGVQGFYNVTNSRRVDLVCEADGNPAPQVSIVGMHRIDLAEGYDLQVDVKYSKRSFIATSAFYNIYTCVPFNYLNIGPIPVGQFVEVGVVKKSMPLIANFTVNGQKGSLNVEQSANVTLRCELLSNVSNFMLLITPRKAHCSQYLHAVRSDPDSSRVQTLTLTASCECSDTYECVAQTPGPTSDAMQQGKYSVDAMAIDIRVNCSSRPAEQAPTVSVYDIHVSAGQIVRLQAHLPTVLIKWQVDGGVVSVTNVTLQCGSLIQTTNGSRGAFNDSYTSFMSRRTCVVTANHVTGVSKSTTFYLTPDLSPLITSFTADNVNTTLTVRRGVTVTFQCLPVTGVGNVTWFIRAKQGHCTPFLYPTCSELNTTVQTYQLTATCDCSDIYQCVAQAPNQVDDVRSVDLLVNCTQYLPYHPPAIVVYNKTVTDGQTVQLDPSNKVVDIRCTVEDGEPKVSNITLKCGDTTQQKNGYSGLFQLAYNTSMDGQLCRCWASHVTGSYNMSTSLTLRIGGNQETKTKKNGAENVGAGSTLIMACLALVGTVQIWTTA